MSLNVLVIPGIWEYILLKKIIQSPLAGEIFAFSREKNLFFDVHGIKNFYFNTFKECENFVLKNNINLVITLAGQVTMSGAVDFLKYNLGIPTIGITKYYKQLEYSKKFGKEFMIRNNIPTSNYNIVKKTSDLNGIISSFGMPLVIKKDTDAGGFGTYICNTKGECEKRVKSLLKEDGFCIAEKYIRGEEVTLQLIWDGNTLLPIAPVRDYKRMKDGNKGINTGSMGCYIPAKMSSGQTDMMDAFVKKLERVFIKEKVNFTGIFACDLIFTEKEVFNLEFNMRPCTPEFEVFLEHINNDILKVLYDTAHGRLNEMMFDYKEGVTGCVNIMYKGFDKNITGIKKIKIPDDILNNTNNISVNGQILNKNESVKILIGIPIFSLIKNDKKDPFPSIYKYIESLDGKNWYFRRDLGEN